MKRFFIISLCLLGFSLSKFDNQTLIDEAEKKYPGRYSGQTFIKIDASKETFPQDGSVESTSCKSRIYAQKRTRYTLNPPYLFMEHDKGLFSAFEFNKCYHTPLHIHTCNRWGEFPNNYKMEYDANTQKVRVLKYKSGTSKTELGDVGCTGTYSASNWLPMSSIVNMQRLVSSRLKVPLKSQQNQLTMLLILVIMQILHVVRKYMERDCIINMIYIGHSMLLKTDGIMYSTR